MNIDKIEDLLPVVIMFIRATAPGGYHLIAASYNTMLAPTKYHIYNSSLYPSHNEDIHKGNSYGSMEIVCILRLHLLTAIKVRQA